MMRHLIPVFLLFFLLSSPFSSYSLRLSHPPILTVRGDGTSPLPVDEAEISATIQSRIESPTPIIQANESNRTILAIYLKSVANKTAAITEKVKNYLSSIEHKIKKLRTTSLSNTPLTQWKDGLMFYYGADSSHSFAFQTSTNNSGPIIDDLIRIGVSRIDSVRLVSSDEAIRLSRMRALSNATKNAWNKIQATVKPFGWNIGSLARKNNEDAANAQVDILSMNIEGVSIRPPPQPRETMAYAGFARMDSEVVPAAPPMPSSNVFASDTTMTASVILRVRLNKKNTTSTTITLPEEKMITAAEASAFDLEDEIEEAVMEQYNNDNNYNM